MSISSALSNAVSGLTVASRQTEIIASNLANATTEGYARRELEISAQTIGGIGAGVQINGVTRIFDQNVLADRRGSQSQLMGTTVTSDFFSRVEQVLGTPEDSWSLDSLITELDTKLIAAASRPDEAVRLAEVVNASQGVATGLRTATDAVQEERRRADASISAQVDDLNNKLAQIQDLNAAILRGQNGKIDMTVYEEQRQLLIDDVSSIVPVRELGRENNQVALYTEGGVALVDGRASQFSFSRTETIVAEMTLASGGLSGLSLNGQDITMDRLTGGSGTGSLAANFSVRDTDAVAVQAQLDGLARDLVERFEAVGSPTTGIGIFTDNGAVLDPLNEVGLAGRITINAVVDPSQGGDVTRIRDGLDATAPGAVGDSTQINALRDALTASQPPASPTFSGAAQTLGSLASNIMTFTSASRQTAEREASMVGAQFDTLKNEELRNGVDSDYELQRLLLVENAYAANARVIQTADQMLEELLRL